LIEQKTGKTFAEALDSMICQPLGLSDTYSPKNNYEIYERVAKAYDFRDGRYQKSPFIDYSLGRRIFSTAADMYVWGRELANPSLISEASTSQIFTNHLQSLDPSMSYGYGWVVFDGMGDYRIGKMDIPGNYAVHGGSTDGYRSIMVIYEGGEWILSLVGNIGDQMNELRIAEEILTILSKGQ
ncbi:MAG: serine hydrolase, partial [Ekhidna sp.]|nr:serine hydrolase [Ekhidna sp.]